MTNPINPINRTNSGTVSNNTGKPQTQERMETARTSRNAEDTVSLSEGSQQVLELQNTLNNIPEVDTARVEAIKQEIAAGNYPLDPVKIAENMIDLEKSLLE